MCYAEVASVGDVWRVRGLYPVMISRKLYEKSPLDLLLPSLHPAKKISCLSPADRVFGWVSQDPAPGDPEPAYRGQLRVGPVTCITENALAPLPESMRSLRSWPSRNRSRAGSTSGSRTGRATEGPRQGGRRLWRLEPDPRAEGLSAPLRVRRSDLEEQRAQQSESLDQELGQTGDVVRPDAPRREPLAIRAGRARLAAVASGRPLSADGAGQTPWVRKRTSGDPLGCHVRVADGSAWAASLVAWNGPPPARFDLSVAKREFEAAMNAANPTLLPAFLKGAGGIRRIAGALSTS